MGIQEPPGTPCRRRSASGCPRRGGFEPVRGAKPSNKVTGNFSGDLSGIDYYFAGNFFQANCHILENFPGKFKFSEISQVNFQNRSLRILLINFL